MPTPAYVDSVVEAARAAAAADPLASAERAETLAQEASAYLEAQDAAAEEADLVNKEAQTALLRAQTKAQCTKEAARAAALSAANAKLEASRLDGLALEARRVADAPQHGSPTGRTRSAGMGVWDVHLAVHCVKPTGKSQREVRMMQKTVEAARDAVNARESEWQRAKQALEEARLELKQREHDEARLREEKENALERLNGPAPVPHPHEHTRSYMYPPSAFLGSSFV